MQTLRSVTDTRRTVVLSIHQPSKILSTIDRILLLRSGAIGHHDSISSLEAFLLSNGFTFPPQLNPLEFVVEILTDLQQPEHEQQSLESTAPPLSPSSIEQKTRSRSSRIREIRHLYYRFWKIIYRTMQLLDTNTLQALGVGIMLDTIYINIGLDKSGIEKQLGLFVFTLTFLLSSTTETLSIFINERPILLREASSGVYRLSSYLIANTLVFISYLLAIALPSSTPPPSTSSSASA